MQENSARCRGADALRFLVNPAVHDAKVDLKRN
jgi:hypothetical protein